MMFLQSRILVPMAALAALGTSALAQANQITFLQIEQRPAVDDRMQQTIFDHKKLIARQQRSQVVDPLEGDCGAYGFQAFEKLGGDALQSVDQLVGVGRLLPE